MERTKVQSKVNMGGLGLDKKAIQQALKDSKGKDVELASFLCVVTSHEEVPSTKDPKKSNTRFRGSFEGTNLLTGESLMGAVAYFPGAVESFLKGLQNGNEAVRCGFVVGAEVNDKSTVGYYFTLEVLTDKKNADPFKEFRAALPAPKKSK